MELPDGFDSVIGEGGASLSGGQAQRLSIARCILKDSPIVILDEATASVDADNETYIHLTLCILLGYCFGTINPAYIISGMLGFDIREKGSGNAGASNAMLMIGKAFYGRGT